MHDRHTSQGQSVDSSPRLHSHARGPGSWLCPLIILVAAFAAYYNSLEAAFVFDDLKDVLRNPRIVGLFPLGQTLGGRRPVVDLTYAVNHQFGGSDPFGYHLLNLVFHALAGVTLLGVLRRTLSLESIPRHISSAAGGLSLAIALIWTVHPLQTQAVTYTVQRAESMMGLFYLLTLYCVIRGATANRRLGWTLCAAASCALGMGSKGVMITAPLVVLLYDRALLAGSLREALRRRWPLYAMLAATWTVLLICGVAGGVLNPARSSATVGFGYRGVSPTGYLLTQVGVIAHYLKLSLWPRVLCLDYGWPTARSLADVWRPAIVVVPLLVGTLWALWRNRLAGFAGVWFFFILAPTSSFVPIKDAAFEHRMYLPLAGVVALVVIGLHTAARRVATRLTPAIAAAVVASAVSLCLWGTIDRNRDYRSKLDIWQDTAQKQPDNARAHHGLGAAWFERGRVAKRTGDKQQARQAFLESEKESRLATRQPDYGEAHYNLGNALVELGRLEESVESYRRSLDIDPGHGMSHYNLANTYKQLGRLDEAVASYREAIRVRPRDRSAVINLGITLKQQGQQDEAVQSFARALELDPNYANAHFHMGDAYFRKRDLPAALQCLDRALQHDPNHPQARELRAIVAELTARQER